MTSVNCEMYLPNQYLATATVDEHTTPVVWDVGDRANEFGINSSPHSSELRQGELDYCPNNLVCVDKGGTFYVLDENGNILDSYQSYKSGTWVVGDESLNYPTAQELANAIVADSQSGSASNSNDSSTVKTPGDSEGDNKTDLELQGDNASVIEETKMNAEDKLAAWLIAFASIAGLSVVAFGVIKVKTWWVSAGISGNWISQNKEEKPLKYSSSWAGKVNDPRYKGRHANRLEFLKDTGVKAAAVLINAAEFDAAYKIYADGVMRMMIGQEIGEFPSMSPDVARMCELRFRAESPEFQYHRRIDQRDSSESDRLAMEAMEKYHHLVDSAKNTMAGPVANWGSKPSKDPSLTEMGPGIS